MYKSVYDSYIAKHTGNAPVLIRARISKSAWAHPAALLLYFAALVVKTQMDSRELLGCFLNKETKIIQDNCLWLSIDVDLENCYSICPSPKQLRAPTPGKAEGSSWWHSLGDKPSSASSEKWLQLFKGEINCTVPTTDSPFQEQQINLPASGTPVFHNNL